jgi:two-component system, cell cycle sensor histidine kinase and response regulator CckA
MSDGKTKVLMLDDERFLLDIYKTAFEKKGYEVTTYSNADDALRELRNGLNPEIILFDITMPDSRSGYDFIETVQREKLVPRALKVALTNEGQDGAIGRMGELGTDAHILKAKYLPAEIVVAVAELLRAKQALA